MELRGSLHRHIANLQALFNTFNKFCQELRAYCQGNVIISACGQSEYFRFSHGLEDPLGPLAMEDLVAPTPEVVGRRNVLARLRFFCFRLAGGSRGSDSLEDIPKAQVPTVEAV